jgi:hypothetical protein
MIVGLTVGTIIVDFVRADRMANGTHNPEQRLPVEVLSCLLNS